MTKQLCIRFLEAELSLLRWLILHKFTTGKAVLSTVLTIREAIERIKNGK